MIEFVNFIPLRDGLKLIPQPDVAYISIHDVNHEYTSRKNEAWGDNYEKQWGMYYSFGFEDAAYDEELIKEFGKDFPKYYADCLMPDKALDIIEAIIAITSNPNIKSIVINCDSGRSRSAAVALFINTKYNIPLLHPVEYPNSLVTKLLNDPTCYDQVFEEFVNQPLKGVKKKTAASSKNDFFSKLSKLLTVLMGK